MKKGKMYKKKRDRIEEEWKKTVFRIRIRMLPGPDRIRMILTGPDPDPQKMWIRIRNRAGLPESGLGSQYILSEKPWKLKKYIYIFMLASFLHQGKKATYACSC